MPKQLVGVDTSTWLFPAPVQAAYQADVQNRITTAVANIPDVATAVANKVAPLTADGQVSPLITTATATRNALDARYKNRLWFDVTDYGATGDGVTDDTAAVQNAINAALSASNPANVEKPTYNGKSPTLFFPLGTYSINTVTVAGTMNFLGVGGGIYAASVLFQRTAGQSMVILAADTDGTSNATVFDQITFKSSSGTSNGTVAQVKTASAIGSNSVYFRRCWFKTPETYAIWITQGDDIQITDCTFDVAPYNSIKLGDRANNLPATNVVISDCTFFDIAVNAIEADLVTGLTIGNNRAYNPDGRTSSTFLTVTSGQAVTSSNNEVSNFAYMTRIFDGQVMRFSDLGFNILTCPYYFGGGNIIYAITIVGATLHGKAAWPNGAFYAAATGLQVCTISKNSIMPGATSTRMFDMADSRVSGNIFNENTSIRFSGNNNFSNAASNGA